MTPAKINSGGLLVPPTRKASPAKLPLPAAPKPEPVAGGYASQGLATGKQRKSTGPGERKIMTKYNQMRNRLGEPSSQDCVRSARSHEFRVENSISDNGEYVNYAPNRINSL
jgi:hypothetical protein